VADEVDNESQIVIHHPAGVDQAMLLARTPSSSRCWRGVLANWSSSVHPQVPGPG